MSIHIKNFINITRLNKPIGYLLLFWPCATGLSLANYFVQDLKTFLYYLSLFFFGSVFMRSAGCIVNDIVDEKIDRKISRTSERPIASGSLNKKLAWLYVLILCSLAFIILIQFNFLTIFLGIFSMIFAFSYPFMKRITYWPQLFLGFTFNWGIIMAWTAMTNNINYLPILLYLGAIFWTLGYDTIYGLQDASEDEIIGVKSTAIKFKNNLNLFISCCYLISSVLVAYVFLNLEKSFYLIMLFLFMLSLFYQIKIYHSQNPDECLKAFKFNNFSGFLLFMSFFLISIKNLWN
tara:strand:- start:2527 stop:3402 length:876 start_codon:yes stop_codon:yes gene_type:complete